MFINHSINDHICWINWKIEWENFNLQIVDFIKINFLSEFILSTMWMFMVVVTCDVFSGTTGNNLRWFYYWSSRRAEFLALSKDFSVYWCWQWQDGSSEHLSQQVDNFRINWQCENLSSLCRSLPLRTSTEFDEDLRTDFVKEKPLMKQFFDVIIPFKQSTKINKLHST